MQTTSILTIDQKLEKLAEINQLVREEGLSFERKNELLRIAVGHDIDEFPEQVESKTARRERYRKAAHNLGISVDQVMWIAARNEEDTFSFQNKENEKRVLFEETTPELNDLISYSFFRESYLHRNDQGCHHLIEVVPGQKDKAASLLKGFRSEFPLIIFETPENGTSLEDDHYNPITDCTHPDFDWAAAESAYQNQLNQNWNIRDDITGKAKNVLCSDDQVCAALKDFALATPELTNAAWVLLYQESYLSKATDDHKEISDCPHYHLIARPGQRENTLGLIKDFKTDLPIIVTEIPVRDYIEKISPSRFTA